MDIKSVPLSRAEEPSEQPLLAAALKGLFDVFKNVFLPHIAVGIFVFLLVTYVSYAFLIAPLLLPDWLELFLLLVFAGVYGAVSFLFALLSAFVCALYRACVAWEELVEKLFDQVKAKMLARLDNMQDGVPKEQAKIAVSGSVKEVVHQFKPDGISAFTRWLAAFGIGCLILAMRSVLVSKIVKWSGKTVNITKLFAGRATLAGAVFLNLRFFSLLLLLVLYTGGALLVAVNLFFVWSVR